MKSEEVLVLLLSRVLVAGLEVPPIPSSPPSAKLMEEARAAQSSVQATKFKILGAREECEQLQAQVISSPDRIKSELAAMQQQVINQRIEHAAESNKLKEEEAKLVTVANLNEDMGKVMGQLKSRGEGRVDMGRASSMVKAQLSS